MSEVISLDIGHKGQTPMAVLCCLLYEEIEMVAKTPVLDLY